MPDYKVNFINQSYRRFFQEHKAEIMDAFERCATNGDFMLREETRQFERKLAEYIGVDYAVLEKHYGSGEARGASGGVRCLLDFYRDGCSRCRAFLPSAP